MPSAQRNPGQSIGGPCGLAARPPAAACSRNRPIPPSDSDWTGGRERTAAGPSRRPGCCPRSALTRSRPSQSDGSHARMDDSPMTHMPGCLLPPDARPAGVNTRGATRPWSPLRWNCQKPDLYPYYNPSPFRLLSTHLTNPCLKMGQYLEIEESGCQGNIDSLLSQGNL